MLRSARASIHRAAAIQKQPHTQYQIRNTDGARKAVAVCPPQKAALLRGSSAKAHPC